MVIEGGLAASCKKVLKRGAKDGSIRRIVHVKMAKGLGFLQKKAYHPGTFKNKEARAAAEEAAQDEARRKAAKLAQLEEERLQAKLREAAGRDGSNDVELDWLYAVDKRDEERGDAVSKAAAVTREARLTGQHTLRLEPPPTAAAYTT